MGFKYHAANGSSKLYKRKCYGYSHDENGKLIIKEDEAEVLRQIFKLYLSGYSIGGIIKELESQNILSPTGKERWYKGTIDGMLSNEKYIGVVRLLDKGDHEVHYLSENNHPPIISKEKFQAVQLEKANRSNVVKKKDGNQRKNSKYSSKKNNK